MRLKFVITTTIPESLNFFKGNLEYLNRTFDVCAISSGKGKLDAIGEREGICTYHIPMKRTISLFRDLACLFQFIWYFLKEKPDLVHGNTPKASMLSMVAARITGVKSRIYMCHGLRFQGSHGMLRWLLVQMEKLTCLCSTKVICVSNGVRDVLINENICNQSKAIVINFGSAAGIDLNRFSTEKGEIHREHIRRELGIGVNDFVYIYIGRIVKDKGINELVAAFMKLQSLSYSPHLILVGGLDNNLDPILETYHENINNSNRIHAVGVQDDIRPFLLASDLFILPSYREGFGMVLIEAGAMGLPCVTTNITGCNEIIIEGENGLVIPPKDEDALKNAMLFLLENPNEVKRLASNARDLVEKRFDQKIVWEAQLEEYVGTLNR